MHILGIETSCDETAASVVRDGRTVLSNVVSSQVQQHASYGGVVPELAAREHLKAIDPIVSRALEEAGCTVPDLDAVGVTAAPGLIPALLVGLSYAKGLAAACDLPLMPVNHILAHIYAAAFDAPALLDDPDAYPLLALVVSGGHTLLVTIQANGEWRIVGRTLDDAAGEAFDKGARILGCGYPGGPIIDRLARTGNPQFVDFPRGLSGGKGRPPPNEHRFDFSFSGVKTALLYRVRDAGGAEALSAPQIADFAASYQRAIVEALVERTLDAAAEFAARTVVVCGGVACNSELRKRLAAAAGRLRMRMVITPPRLCTDNAAMIAGLAFHDVRAGKPGRLDVAASARMPEHSGRLTFPPMAVPPAP